MRTGPRPLPGEPEKFVVDVEQFLNLGVHESLKFVSELSGTIDEQFGVTPLSYAVQQVIEQAIDVDPGGFLESLVPFFARAETAIEEIYQHMQRKEADGGTSSEAE